MVGDGEGGEPAVLLAAKSAPPAIRARLVERADLIDVLSAEPFRRLTLLSAPAGWGKTTLLAQWVSGADDKDRVAARKIIKLDRRRPRANRVRQRHAGRLVQIDLQPAVA